MNGRITISWLRVFYGVAVVLLLAVPFLFDAWVLANTGVASWWQGIGAVVALFAMYELARTQARTADEARRGRERQIRLSAQVAVENAVTVVGLDKEVLMSIRKGMDDDAIIRMHGFAERAPESAVYKDAIELLRGLPPEAMHDATIAKTLIESRHTLAAVLDTFVSVAKLIQADCKGSDVGAVSVPITKQLAEIERMHRALRAQSDSLRKAAAAE